MAGLKPFLPALLLAVATLVALAVLNLGPTSDARQVAALFPPWLSFADRMAGIRAAGGIALDEGGWSSIVLVSLPGGARADGLLEQGAWLLLDPRGARGCGTAQASGTEPTPL